MISPSWRYLRGRSTTSSASAERLSLFPPPGRSLSTRNRKPPRMKCSPGFKVSMSIRVSKSPEYTSPLTAPVGVRIAFNGFDHSVVEYLRHHEDMCKSLESRKVHQTPSIPLWFVDFKHGYEPIRTKRAESLLSDLPHPPMNKRGAPRLGEIDSGGLEIYGDTMPPVGTGRGFNHAFLRFQNSSKVFLNWLIDGYFWLLFPLWQEPCEKPPTHARSPIRMRRRMVVPMRNDSIESRMPLVMITTEPPIAVLQG